MSLSGGYDFSQLYHSSTAAFSPGSTFLATAHGRRIIVRSSASLSIVRTFQCLGGSPSASTSRQTDTVTIDQLLWSFDSMYVMAFSLRAMTAWIFGLTDEGNGQGGEVARIGGEGAEGLTRVEWGRSGREVLAWSDYGLRLAIWNLSTGSASYVQYPKSATNSRYLAIAEKHSSKDFVGIYDSQAGYSLLRHFTVQTSDCQDLLWSPCGRYIAVYEALLNYALYIYSPLGPLLHAFTTTSPSFSPSSSTEDPGLGIRCAQWAPGGRWIALGGWDGRVRVVESEGGRCVATLAFPAKSGSETTSWREPSEWLKDTRGRGIVQFNKRTGASPLPTVRSDVARTPPRSGVSQLAFDAEATFLLVRLETQPSVVHIHTFLPTPGSSSPDISHLATLVFTEAVRTARWCSGRRKVAVTAKSGGVYFWDGDGGWVEDGDESGEAKGGVTEGVGIPTLTDFTATDAIWAPDGNSLCILDKPNAQFCLLYDDAPAESTDTDYSLSRRWDGNEGLTHIHEEEEEEGDRSVLSSLAEAEGAWTRGNRVFPEVPA